MSMGIATCFGPYGVGMNVPSPIGDVVGNCFVTALDPLGAEFMDGESPMKHAISNAQQESNYVIEPQQKDLYAIGACDAAEQRRSPLTSPELGGGIAVDGRPTAVQATNSSIGSPYWIGEL